MTKAAQPCRRTTLLVHYYTRWRSFLFLSAPFAYLSDNTRVVTSDWTQLPPHWHVGGLGTIAAYDSRLCARIQHARPNGLRVNRAECRALVFVPCCTREGGYGISLPDRRKRGVGCARAGASRINVGKLRAGPGSCSARHVELLLTDTGNGALQLPCQPSIPSICPQEPRGP